MGRVEVIKEWFTHDYHLILLCMHDETWRPRNSGHILLSGGMFGTGSPFESESDNVEAVNRYNHTSKILRSDPFRLHQKCENRNKIGQLARPWHD